MGDHARIAADLPAKAQESSSRRAEISGSAAAERILTEDRRLWEVHGARGVLGLERGGRSA